MKEIPFKIVCLILLFASLESCSKYSNIYEIKPQSALIKDKEYLEFENDTVKITYSFWGKAGVMSYTIFNKMNIPIYIDWKKSSVVKNEQKYDYWVDEINTKSKSQSTGSSNSSLYYGGYNLFNYNLVKSESKSIKPERVTFLSPKSSVTRMQSILYNLVPEKLLQPVRKGKLLDKDGKKNVTVDYIEMSKNE